MTYAGRLDPMASGVMLVLTGEECKKKEKYLKLDKEYEFEILFGFATDTYDILGKITHLNILQNDKMLLQKKIEKKLKHFRGKILQKYPPYSSKTWARARKGGVINVEVKKVKVYKLNFSALKSISSGNLLKNIEKRIRKVKGDFRQKEILKLWQKRLINNNTKFLIGSFKIKCSSGTYVRGIANSLGERIGVPALAFSIKRTKVGNYKQAE